MEQAQEYQKVRVVGMGGYIVVSSVIWYRWLGSWGVGIASEKKMRAEATELVGDNLSAELAPFSFPHKDGGEIIQTAPYAYIPNLWDKVKDLLDQNSDEQRGYALPYKVYLNTIYLSD